MTAAIKIGTIVRYKWDDGSMGFAEVVGFHNDSVWVRYEKASRYRTYKLADLEIIA